VADRHAAGPALSAEVLALLEALVRRPAGARHDYLRWVRRPVDLSLPLSIEEAWLLVRALSAHVDTWRRHDDEDGGSTHTPEEWEAVRTASGHLIWRLEELAVLPGQVVQHTEYAVQPPDDEDDGEAGVREPRRPDQPSPSTRSRT
jgi:hypothetical protein